MNSLMVSDLCAAAYLMFRRMPPSRKSCPAVKSQFQAFSGIGPARRKNTVSDESPKKIVTFNGIKTNTYGQKHL